MTQTERIEQLHQQAVETLVESHKRIKGQKLLLAARYKAKDPSDVFLLEVVQGFPGNDDDELFATEFPPSARLRILGKLQLVLASPGQIATALNRRDPTLVKLKHGKVVYLDSGSAKAKAVKKSLGL